MPKKSPITGLDPYDPAGIFKAADFHTTPDEVNMFDPLNTTETTWKALGWQPYHDGGHFNFYDPMDIDQRIGLSPGTIRAIGLIAGTLFGLPEVALGANAAAGDREGGRSGASTALLSSIATAFAPDVLSDVGSRIGGALDGSTSAGLPHGEALSGTGAANPNSALEGQFYESLSSGNPLTNDLGVDYSSAPFFAQSGGSQTGGALGRELGRIAPSVVGGLATRESSAGNAPAGPLSTPAPTTGTGSGGGGGSGLGIGNSTAPQIYPWIVPKRRTG